MTFYVCFPPYSAKVTNIVPMKKEVQGGFGIPLRSYMAVNMETGVKFSEPSSPERSLNHYTLTFYFSTNFLIITVRGYFIYQRP